MRELCLKCLKSTKACLCSFIKPFETNSTFCILMHPMEAYKEKVGTGRATHLFLKNSKLLIGVNFNDNKNFIKLVNDESYFPLILYPGENAINLSSKNSADLAVLKDKKLLIIVIDGTWPCAKKIMRESTILHSLPRLSFNNDNESNFSIKHQPDKYCLSTIESVHKVINLLATHEIEKPSPNYHDLLKYLDEMVAFQIRCAQDPSKNFYRNKNFTKPIQRERAKKWDKRNILFSESI